MLFHSIQQTLSTRPTPTVKLAQPTRQHWSFALALVAWALYTLCFSPAARAEIITLTCAADQAANQKQLIQAIEAANSTVIADTIMLAKNCAYRFDRPLVSGSVDALPVISQTLTLEGNSTVMAASFITTEVRLLHTTANLTVRNLTLLPGRLVGKEGGAAILAEHPAKLTLSAVDLSGGKAPYGGGIAALGDLTITAGSFRRGEATMQGGAIFAQGQLTITQSVFEDNRASLYGGAVYLAAAGGPTAIRDSYFGNNRAGSDGGAINALSPLVISSSDFYSNSALLQGGAIYGETPITLHNSSLRQNLAGNQGGAIMSLEPLTVSHSALLTNQVRMAYGGAIYAAATVRLQRNFFEANQAPLAGAVLYSDQQRGQSVIDNNLFLDNFTAGFPKQPLLCVVCDEFGGGSVELKHNTFVQSAKPAEIAVQVNAGTVQVQYNIIANHELAVKRQAGTVTSSHNLYFGNGQDEVNLTGNANITGQDPKFVRPALKDYRPAVTSPALDRASGSTTILDAQGIQRPQHGEADIGAYEFDHGEVPASEVQTLTTCEFNDLIQAVNQANARPGRQQLVLPVGCTYVYNHTTAGAQGLPTITDALIIAGNQSTIRYSNSTDRTFRLLRSRDAALQLHDLTLANTGQMTDGRACAVSLYSQFFPPPAAALTQVTINTNICSGAGAALYAEQYAVQIHNCRFENNMIIQKESSLAVVETRRSWLEVDQSQFISTVAADNSAAIKVTNGGIELRNSTFIGNQAAYGSGLTINTNQLPSQLINNVWFNNQSSTPNGAVVRLGNQAPVTVLHNTFANQTASNGSAIQLYEPALALASAAPTPLELYPGLTVTVHNSIFANISTSLAADPPGRPLVASHNLFWNSTPTGDAATALKADPLFVALASGDLQLQATSPAIDAGLPVAVVADFTGGGRPAGAGFDMGAYEFGATPPPLPTATPTPTGEPTPAPTGEPTPVPTGEPTPVPTGELTPVPTGEPTPVPTGQPTPVPQPTAAPGELRAVDDNYLVANGTTLTVTSPGVRQNDSFPASVTVQVVLQAANTRSAGQLQLQADGALVYTPATNFTGVDSFTYYLQAGEQKSNPATVTITVANAATIQHLYLPVVRR